MALYLTLPTWSLNPHVTPLSEALVGFISQVGKLRLTDTQGHAVNQWQSWAQVQPSLSPSTDCHTR